MHGGDGDDKKLGHLDAQVAHDVVKRILDDEGSGTDGFAYLADGVLLLGVRGELAVDALRWWREQKGYLEDLKPRGAPK